MINNITKASCILGVRALNYNTRYYFHAWIVEGTCNDADEVKGTEACRKPVHWGRDAN